MRCPADGFGHSWSQLVTKRDEIASDFNAVTNVTSVTRGCSLNARNTCLCSSVRLPRENTFSRVKGIAWSHWSHWSHLTNTYRYDLLLRPTVTSCDQSLAAVRS